MFKKFFFFLSFCIVSFVAPAQFFLPVGDDPFAVPISFNAAGVMQNKVKSHREIKRRHEKDCKQETRREETI